MVFSLSPVSKVLHVIRRIYENMFTVFTYECSTVLVQAIGLQPLTDLFHIHNSVFCNIHTLHFSTTFLFSFDWFLFPEVSCKWRETSFPFVPLQLLLNVDVAFGLLVISLMSCCRKIVFRQFRYTNTRLRSLPRLFKWGLIGIEEILHMGPWVEAVFS